MKTTLVLAMSLLMAGTATAQTLKTGIDPANLDTSVSPGENFFLYAAGGWMKNHPLDDEHSSNGAFVDLSEQNTKRIQDLILQFANTPQYGQRQAEPRRLGTAEADTGAHRCHQGP